MLSVLADNVLIEVGDQEEKTDGGIIIPDVAKQERDYGTVVAVGRGKVTNDGLVACEVKVGSKVYFGKYAGTELQYKGKTYKIVQEKEILCVEN